MWPCRTRRSTSPTGTSRSTSERRSSPAATSPRRSRRRSSRSVDAEEGLDEGYDGHRRPRRPRHGRKVRFIGALVGEWMDTSKGRQEHFRVFRGRTGKYVLHVEREPEYWAVDAEGKPAGWRGWLGIGDVRYGEFAQGVHARGPRHARGAPRQGPVASCSRWSPAPPASRPWRTSTSDRARRRAAAQTAGGVR